MAYREACRTLFPRPGASLDRATVSASVDRCWKLLLTAERQEASFDMFLSGDATGSYMCICIYVEWTRACRQWPRAGCQPFSICNSSRPKALQRLVCSCNILSGAWGLKYTRYGLGTCYLRMNKVRLAEYHYRKAAEIHPNNAILIGCIGLVRARFFLPPGFATTTFRQRSGPETAKRQFNYTQKLLNCVLRTPLFVTVEGSC